MEGEVGRRVVDVVPVVFWVVAGIEGEGALADAAVDVLDTVGALFLAKEDDRVLDQRLAEGRSLTEEAIDDVGVALGEHRRHGVVFGRELEQREILSLGRADPAHVVWRGVDV